MKYLFSLILSGLLCLNLYAQTDTTKVEMGRKNVVTVIENVESTHVKVGNDKGIEVVTDDRGDTTHLRIGRRTFKVIEGNNGTYVKFGKEESDRKKTGNFNPHWAEIGRAHV